MRVRYVISIVPVLTSLYDEFPDALLFDAKPPKWHGINEPIRQAVGIRRCLNYLAVMNYSCLSYFGSEGLLSYIN